MNTVPIHELMNRIERLTLADRMRVVQFVDALKPVGVTKEQLLAATGGWTTEDAREIQEIVDAEFKRIDLNEW